MTPHDRDPLGPPPRLIEPRDIPLYAWIIFVLLLLLIGGKAHATQVTGHLNYGGQPLTGYVKIGLVYPGTNGTALDLPGAPDPLPVYNGNFPAMTVDGNDTLLPRGTFYQVTYYDASQAALARMNYVISGASFDLGTAVPTPITPSNINYLDLLGLRTISAQTLQLTTGLTLGPVSYSSTGVNGAKVWDDWRFAAGYASSSSSCGINEAIAALPASGGTVILGAGACTVTTPITVTKPISLVGLGEGGSTGTSTYTSPTVLLNGMAASPLITVTPSTAALQLSGVRLSNFAIQGNIGVSGASAGSDILLAGQTGAGGLTNITLDHLLLYSAHDSGVAVTDNATAIHLDHVVSIRNGVSGVSLSTTTGSLSNFTLTECGLDYNGDGLTIAGSGVGRVTVTDSYFTNSTTNGVYVAGGATAAIFRAFHSSFVGNGNAGVYLADGFGHVVESSTILGNGRQVYGIYDAQPTITSSTVQLTLRDDNLSGNSTDDLFQAASVSNLLIYPQSTAFTSSYGNPATVFFMRPFVPGSSGQTILSLVLGSNYQNLTGHTITIEGWGVVASGSGDTEISCWDGPSSPSIEIWGDVVESTAAGNKAEYHCTIPDQYWYSVHGGARISSLGQSVQVITN